MSRVAGNELEDDVRDRRHPHKIQWLARDLPEDVLAHPFVPDLDEPRQHAEPRSQHETLPWSYGTVCGHRVARILAEVAPGHGVLEE